VSRAPFLESAGHKTLAGSVAELSMPTLPKRRRDERRQSLRLEVSPSVSSWSINYEEISGESEVCAHRYPSGLSGGRRIGTNKKKQKQVKGRQQEEARYDRQYHPPDVTLGRLWCWRATTPLEGLP
jgi:hypothetical protein